MTKIDEVTAAFLRAAVWADAPEDDPDAMDSGDPPRGMGEDWFDENRFAPSMLDWAQDFCRLFRVYAEQAFPGIVERMGEDRFGHDIWLTCRGHGTGFWDREDLDAGERDTLTDLARKSRLDGSLYREDDSGLWNYE